MRADPVRSRNSHQKTQTDSRNAQRAVRSHSYIGLSEPKRELLGLPKHPEARLWPSEVVTLGLLHALKGGGNRAFYRWLTRDYRPLFPRLPERTRLFRLFTTHQDWTQAFMASPTVLGVIDTYGIELIH